MTATAAWNMLSSCGGLRDPRADTPFHGDTLLRADTLVDYGVENAIGRNPKTAEVKQPHVRGPMELPRQRQGSVHRQP